MRWMSMFSLILFSSLAMAISPLVSVDVDVIDEAGLPVNDVKVTGTFLDGRGFDTDTSITDKAGSAVVRGRSPFPVGILVEKNGYYPSGLKVVTTKSVKGKVEYEEFHRAEITIRKKLNPIPLYAKNFIGYLPVKGQWVGFDMEKGDWVAPHGKGYVQDLLFKYSGSSKDYFTANGKLDMKFSVPYDGVVDIDRVDLNSQLKVPHHAPSASYAVKDKHWVFNLGKGVSDSAHASDESKYYFLRIRSAGDDNGNPVQSNFAKIYHDISFDPRIRENEEGVAVIMFTYYFNPNPNDHNLEFDIEKNLFNDLRYDAQVREP